jgi:hypothetical protein
VQAVIAARLGALPAEYKQLLQAAAVVEQTFWAGAVAALTDTDQTVVSNTLQPTKTLTGKGDSCGSTRFASR